MHSDHVIGRVRGGAERKRVLMLTHRAPYPPDSGVRIRGYHILQHLSARFDVSLACVSDEPVTEQQWQVMEGLADRVAVQRITPRWGKVRGLASLLCGGAVTPAYFYRKPLARTIRRWHRMAPFDAVFTFCTGMIDYARQVTQQPGGRRRGDTHDLRGRRLVRHVIDLVDVDSAKWLDYAADARGPVRWMYQTEARRIRDIEAGRFDRFDAVAVVSAAEATLYRQTVGYHPNLTVLRHAVDADYFQPLPDSDSNRIVFIGVLDYKPNVEGIAWFVKHVMPSLRAQCPQVELQIIGRRPTERVRVLGESPGVEVVGPVDDVRDYLRDAAAVIAPLRIARGVQTKVLEAMAAGRAVVCSPGAAEGIFAEHGEHLLVADQPAQWVAQLSRVLGDRLLRHRLAAAARQRIDAAYRWQRCLEPLERLITGDDAEQTRTGLIPLRQAA